MKRRFTVQPKLITASTNRRSEVARRLRNYWDTHPDTFGGSYEYYANGLREEGFDVTSDEISDAWDEAGSNYDYEDDTSVILSDGMEIDSRKQAYIWLVENLEQYGNTFFWGSELRSDLDKLISRFGSTYFWRS